MSNSIVFFKGCAITYAKSYEGGFGEGKPCLLHVCNAQGVMGAGIAKQIRKQDKTAYEAYKARHELGDVTYSSDGRIANMVAQEFYGREDKRYLSYSYLTRCFNKIVEDLAGDVDELVIPFQMGCGLAGGDWSIVMDLIKGLLQPHFHITIMKLE